MTKATLVEIYLRQQWFNLLDPQGETMLYDSESMQRFARIDLLQDTVPDGTTICRFRHRLEAHQLTARMFSAVKGLLKERNLLLRAGTFVHDSITGAPSSPKNATQTRDPEMRQTRKGNPWCFGMNVQLGRDHQGVIRSLTMADAAAADITQLPQMLHAQETTLHGEKAWDKAEDELQRELSGGRYLVNESGWSWVVHATDYPLGAYAVRKDDVSGASAMVVYSGAGRVVDALEAGGAAERFRHGVGAGPETNHFRIRTAGVPGASPPAGDTGVECGGAGAEFPRAG